MKDSKLNFNKDEAEHLVVDIEDTTANKVVNFKNMVVSEMVKVLTSKEGRDVMLELSKR